MLRQGCLAFFGSGSRNGRYVQTQALKLLQVGRDRLLAAPFRSLFLLLGLLSADLRLGRLFVERQLLLFLVLLVSTHRRRQVGLKLDVRVAHLFSATHDALTLLFLCDGVGRRHYDCIFHVLGHLEHVVLGSLLLDERRDWGLSWVASALLVRHQRHVVLSLVLLRLEGRFTLVFDFLALKRRDFIVSRLDRPLGLRLEVGNHVVGLVDPRVAPLGVYLVARMTNFIFYLACGISLVSLLSLVHFRAYSRCL